MEVIKGRMYDYNNGRFLSVDPFIQDPSSTQSMNPYTYIFNNPLSGVDPSGYLSEEPCGPNDFACQWDQSMASVLGVPREVITAHYNGLRAKNNNKNDGNNSEKESQSSIALRNYAKGILKECRGGVGCSDSYVKYARELANGTTRFPSDSIILPASPDDNGVRVRISPSQNLIIWEAPDGSVSTQDIKEFGEQAVTNGVIFVALSALGVTGRTGGTGSVKITVPYKRPSGATTPAQRASVQNKPCVDCGTTTSKQYADHKEPLVVEYWRTGAIDKIRMKKIESVQPQCPTCSNKQGGTLRVYSLKKRKENGIE